MNPMVNCNGCNGDCCREICVEIDEPKKVEDWDIIRWMVAHENISVYVDDEDDWLVEVKTNCSKLDPNSKCKIYNKRPLVCKNHDPSTCVKNAEDDGEKLRFNTLDEVEAHIEKVIKPKLQSDLKDWKL